MTVQSSALTIMGQEQGSKPRHFISHCSAQLIVKSKCNLRSKKSDFRRVSFLSSGNCSSKFFLRYSIHYEDIDLKKFTFSGYVDIKVNVVNETDFIMLNAKELTISVLLFS